MKIIAALLTALCLTGCVTDNPFAVVQNVVDKSVPSWAQSGVAWLRTEEGKSYAVKNGLVSTNGATTSTRLWSTTEQRWIEGIVIPYDTITIQRPPVGSPIPAFTPSPTVPAVPASPPVGGNGAVGDPLDAEVNSTLEPVK